MHLKELKRCNPKAYEAYVELLVEDCEDEFTDDMNGKVRVTGHSRGYTFVGTYREGVSEPWDMTFVSGPR